MIEDFWLVFRNLQYLAGIEEQLLDYSYIGRWVVAMDVSYNDCVLQSLVCRQWSDRGCKEDMETANGTETSCDCNHTTSFAVLMQVVHYEVNYFISFHFIYWFLQLFHIYNFDRKYKTKQNSKYTWYNVANKNINDTKFRVEFWKNVLQNLLVHYAVSSDSALQTVLSQTNGRLPLSSQFTREIPSLIQLSTGQFPCWASLARWWNLRSTSSFRITCSPISWSLADNLASDHIIAPPTFSPSLHRLGMHL